ncbi:t-SNARE [Absidia repens]|uniref:t-SNARE n=1 Tax=Absidia repens TaxID=90262 RepID=A0A1X2IDT9_9FUNG|nr:t-SNARE [Absidia repens]
MEDDPFVIVENQVKDSLTNANNLYESWKRIRQTVKSANNQELLWTADELSSSLDAIEQDLDDLDEALTAAKANPQQFQLSTSVLFYGKIQKENRGEKMMFREQDQHLDSMTGTLVNLKGIAGTMNNEIDDHVILLDELGDNVDRSEGRLKRAMHKVTDILRKEEGKWKER